MRSKIPFGFTTHRSNLDLKENPMVSFTSSHPNPGMKSAVQQIELGLGFQNYRINNKCIVSSKRKYS
jgi:hypothetical protein